VHQEQLHAAQEELGNFRQKADLVLIDQQKELLLRKLIDLEGAFKENEANRSESEQRILTLRSQLDSANARITTQSRSLPNQYSVERLNTLATELQNKRTELLTKFHPEDRLVKQVEQQLLDTRKAMSEAAQINSVEQVTDVNPVRQGLESELARAQFTVAGLRARGDSQAKQRHAYRAELAKLEMATVEHDDRARAVKNLESSLLLYSRRREEARIEDALDQQKITNVVISEPPSESITPKAKLSFAVASLFLLGQVVIVTSVLMIGLKKHTAYTPFEFEIATGIPVLATVPYSDRDKRLIELNAADIRETPEEKR
jgi:uncharacterized protein involved in exopolysaccharide biosynthesis